MINISNYTSEDNTPRLAVPPPRTATAAGAPTRTAAGGLLRDVRDGRDRRRERALAGHLPFAAVRILVTAGRVLLSWLAAVPRRLGDRLFVTNDTEAYWRSWQITRIHGGFGRRYRDPRFDTLAECPKCYGTGRTQGGPRSRAADLPCAPCLGTGRITLGEVS